MTVLPKANNTFIQSKPNETQIEFIPHQAELTELLECGEAPEKRQYLKKGEKSRKVYDPKQAIIKQHKDKRDQMERIERHQTMF